MSNILEHDLTASVMRCLQQGRTPRSSFDMHSYTQRSSFESAGSQRPQRSSFDSVGSGRPSAASRGGFLQVRHSVCSCSPH